MRNVRGSGKGRYALPVSEKSAYSSMECPTSTTTRKGGQPSETGSALAYRSAWPRAASIASSQPCVPRTAVPRLIRRGSLAEDRGGAEFENGLLPCLASRTKQLRL